MIGLSKRSVSSTKFGMRSRSLAQQLLQVRPFTQEEERGREQPHGRLLARREQVRGDAHDVDDLGRRAVGERRGGEPGQHVVARLAAAVLDVRR